MHGSAKVVLTGYIHLVTKTEHLKGGRAVVHTACGAKDAPYTWGRGGLRITSLASLVECPACRTTEAFWDRAGDVARVASGRAPQWAVGT